MSAVEVKKGETREKKDLKISEVVRRTYSYNEDNKASLLSSFLPFPYGKGETGRGSRVPHFSSRVRESEGVRDREKEREKRFPSALVLIHEFPWARERAREP